MAAETNATLPNTQLLIIVLGGLFLFKKFTNKGHFWINEIWDNRLNQETYDEINT